MISKHVEETDSGVIIGRTSASGGPVNHAKLLSVSFKHREEIHPPLMNTRLEKSTECRAESLTNIYSSLQSE